MWEWFNEEIRCQWSWEITIEIWNRVVKRIAAIGGETGVVESWNCWKGIDVVELINGRIVKRK